MTADAAGYELTASLKTYNPNKVRSLFFYFARKINILAEAGRQLPGQDFLLLFCQEKSRIESLARARTP